MARCCECDRLATRRVEVWRGAPPPDLYDLCDRDLERWRRAGLPLVDAGGWLWRVTLEVPRAPRARGAAQGHAGPGPDHPS